jgi:hypothetical protein
MAEEGNGRRFRDDGPEIILREWQMPRRHRCEDPREEPARLRQSHASARRPTGDLQFRPDGHPVSQIRASEWFALRYRTRRNRSADAAQRQPAESGAGTSTVSPTSWFHSGAIYRTVARLFAEFAVLHGTSGAGVDADFLVFSRRAIRAYILQR